MSEPSTIGFTPIPGSSAADAMAKVDTLALRPGNIQSEIVDLMRSYGVDKMTAAAAGESAAQIVANNPRTYDAEGNILNPGTDLNQLAKDLVGNAVADPRVAANRAAARVDGLDPALSKAEQANQAVAIAGQEAAAAGADSSVAEAKTREALAAGMSPRNAALAGTAAAVSLAVANNPNPSGLEIFGYFKAMVQGLVMETYLGTEKKTITNLAHWKVDNSFIQTTSGKLEVNCRHYRATAEHDESVADHSIGIYLAGYSMYALHPLTIIGASGSGAAVSTTVNWGKMSSIAPYKEIGFLRDFYVALLGTEVTDKHRADVKKKMKTAALAVWNVRKKIKFG